jgi:hypothetical protein
VGIHFVTNALPWCPTCRTQISGLVPNFTTRDVVGVMKVKCTSTNECDDKGESNKRMKRDDGEMVVENNSCSWSGLCADLKKHEDVCEFKVIPCNIQGCDHRCRRKDMICIFRGMGYFFILI